MRLIRHAARVAGDIALWSFRSGRLWILALMPLLVVAGLLLASSKAAVATFIYTLF